MQASFLPDLSLNENVHLFLMKMWVLKNFNYFEESMMNEGPLFTHYYYLLLEYHEHRERTNVVAPSNSHTSNLVLYLPLSKIVNNILKASNSELDYC